MSDHAKVDNVHTRRIAEFVSGLTYDAIPLEVRERIKLLILDSLGCAIYGAKTPWCEILQACCPKSIRPGRPRCGEPRQSCHRRMPPW